jgi:prepilin-type processing-associated H-X9-DG protein
VIGIIALLISILLPALNKARRAAQTTTCMSNLRQVGIAYRFYAESNKGYLPYLINRSWFSTLPGETQRRLFWYMALAPYLTKGYDPMATTPARDLPQIFKACPTWNQWVDANDASAEWVTGYGQNVYLFSGNYDRRGVAPGGRRRATLANTGAPGDNVTWGLDSRLEPDADNLTTDKEYVGQVLLAKIPNPSTRIIAGDATQFWMGLKIRINNSQIPDDVKMDFERANQISAGDPSSQFATDVFVKTNWSSGHPNRHGGEFADCQLIGTGPRVTVAKANYLYVDGHVQTLSYIEARRTMQMRPR